MIVAFSSSAAQSACHDFERHDKDSSVSKASEVRQGSVRRARCMSSDVEVVDARDEILAGAESPFDALLAVAVAVVLAERCRRLVSGRSGEHASAETLDSMMWTLPELESAAVFSEKLQGIFEK